MDPSSIEINYIEFVIRLLITIFIGGFIGWERGRKGRAAGFRTHVLVCLGSALAMMTNIYCTKYFGADSSRIGASVVSGIGFLGAGTIMVTGKRQIKGLTTAASLWTCACLGMAVGCGLYIPAITGFVLVVAVNSVMSKFEGRVRGISKQVAVYVEMENVSTIRRIMKFARDNNIDVQDMERYDEGSGVDEIMGMYFKLILPQKEDHTPLKKKIEEIEGVDYVEFLHI